MNFKKSKYKTGEKALTQNQVKKLLDVIGDVEDEALIRLAVTTGLRRSDIVRVRVADVDVDAGTLSFYEAKKDIIRQVYLQPSTCTCLRKHMKTKAKGALLFNFSSRTAWNRLNKWLDRAGLPRRPFHALRSTTIKLCQQAGWPIEMTAALVNDKIATVQEHYLCPSQEEMKETTDCKPTI